MSYNFNCFFYILSIFVLEYAVQMWVLPAFVKANPTAKQLFGSITP